MPRRIKPTTSIADIWSYVTRILTNLDATRAALIDNLDVLLSSRAPAAEYDTELDAIISSRAPASEYDTTLARKRVVETFVAYNERVTLTAGAGDKTLSNIVIGTLPSGLTIRRIFGRVLISIKENTNVAVNKVSGAQYIQIKKSGGTWRDFIQIPDDALLTPATTREGGAVIGYEPSGVEHTALLAEIDENGLYNTQWASGVADAANLVLEHILIMLFIIYE